MKKLYLIIVITLCSCGNSTQMQTVPTVGKISTQNGEKSIYVYVIDGCEYIGFVNGSNGDFLTHKGNCKNCLRKANQSN